jgi:hypothetical protein
MEEWKHAPIFFVRSPPNMRSSSDRLWLIRVKQVSVIV